MPLNTDIISIHQFIAWDEGMQAILSTYVSFYVPFYVGFMKTSCKEPSQPRHRPILLFNQNFHGFFTISGGLDQSLAGIMKFAIPRNFKLDRC